MPIRFSCPRCSSVLESPDNSAGLKFSCGKCGQRLQVPEPPKPPPQPPLNKTVLGKLEDMVDAVPVSLPVSPAPLILALGERDRFCRYCGAVILVEAEICPKCGVRQLGPASGPPRPPLTPGVKAHRGIDVMVRGIVSVSSAGIGLLFFCNWLQSLRYPPFHTGYLWFFLIFTVAGLVTGILAISGGADLRAMKKGRMDPSGKGMTRAGLICGQLGFFISLAILVILLFLLILAVGQVGPLSTPDRF